MTDPYYIEAMTESAERLCDCGAELEDWEDQCEGCEDHDHRYNSAPFCGKCGGACVMGKDCVCCGAKMDNNDSTQLCWQCQILIEEN